MGINIYLNLHNNVSLEFLIAIYLKHQNKFLALRNRKQTRLNVFDL